MPTGVYKRSKEAIENNRISHLGKIPWNKGKTGIYSEETLEKMREGRNSQQTEFKKGHIGWNKGGYRSEKVKEKISKANKGKHFNINTEFEKGENHPNYGKKGKDCPLWKGGITPLLQQIRHNFKYRQWRSDVFTRDNFTCQDCGDDKGGNLEAHHKKTLSSILQYYEITTLEGAMSCEELWNINNGITLCKDCHKKLHKKINLIKAV